MKSSLKRLFTPFILLIAFQLITAQTLEPTYMVGPEMHVARMGHHNVATSDGHYLLIGGRGTNFVSLGTSDLVTLNPDSCMGHAMNYVHDFAAVCKLTDGRLLIAGGSADLGVAPGYNTAEIYDPVSKSYGIASNLNYGRMNCSAALLNDSTVLIAGGWYDQTSATYGEIYNVAVNQFTTTGALNNPRSNPLVISTSDGGAVVLGGTPAFGGNTFENVEYYDPETNTFQLQQDYLFGEEETGWSPFSYSSYNRQMETQRLTDGTYLLMAYKQVESDYEYTLFSFDPETCLFSKWGTEPELPTSASHAYYAPIVDNEKAVAYIPAVKKGSDPVELTLFAVNLNDTSLVMVEEYYQFPANYYLGYAGFLLLSDGRILVSGGHEQTGYNTNFSPHAHTLIITPGYTVTTIDQPAAPKDFEFVLENYPNPFNATTTFAFKVEKASVLRFEIVNSAGQIVYSADRQSYPAGRHVLRWDATHLPSGIYYARLTSAKTVSTRKVALIK